MKNTIKLNINYLNIELMRKLGIIPLRRYNNIDRFLVKNIKKIIHNN